MLKSDYAYEQRRGLRSRTIEHVGDERKIGSTTVGRALVPESARPIDP